MREIVATLFPKLKWGTQTMYNVGDAFDSFTINELQLAKQSLKMNKAPGPKQIVKHSKVG